MLAAGRNSARAASPFAHLQGRRRQQLKVYRANYFRSIARPPGRPLRRRSGAGHRQHQGPVRAAARPTTTVSSGCRGCGGATSRPDTGRRCRTRRCWPRPCAVRRLPRRRAGRRELLRRRSAAARILRRHTGFGHRCGQRHRPRDRAGVRRAKAPNWSISDIDEAGVKETAAQIAARGGVASLRLDVADADAVERFAEGSAPTRRARHRGQQRRHRSGRTFLDTPAEQWDRVLDINLGGVVNCCRAFARGSSTAAPAATSSTCHPWRPTRRCRSMNAYCTSKAAVYMFCDCLRAELAAAGVGLTTICPGVIDTNIVHTTRFDVPALQSRTR